MVSIKLIIGLGNPDEEYQNTRHNVGFMFLDYLARRSLGEGGSAKKIGTNDFEEDKKRNALISKSRIEKVSVVLVKPLCYVNKSGEVVSKLAKFYKIKPADIIVVQDDLDIEFGSFKNSFEKNSGGHKGVESIIKALKTKKFYRLRIGTSVRALLKAREQSDKKRDAFVMNFVLAKFSPKDQDIIKKMFPAIYERLLQII
ncbi:MAG: hypothetical protein A2915_00630 [Candidatus Yanofskybacteria bacterium RIFCSPLOWO2_01_FULL_41_34]|uniref:Peptidyl-tRNA hydrolase n=1 Tax=Candidatus Yanofskybacteria bacterium RIFCSPHIGHO2_01_FULL_41_26 TaxID=1802661 RepID=A0A1F8EEP9_9BACT|nr:MAG: hypothetical protein A2649_02660 [Candidatus Yanofskybacteria bacterium RIFCSPHIGHO2_01_FULL_41_26]OGN22403.1 MAG: hypothetical protein A2915_00630 [Candidatus Yanofskybacteria bacterium RIFCSPLOWO2_01_FULL_41_34]